MVWDGLQFAGSALFMACLVPQFVRTLRRGHADDVSVGFLVLVLLASALLVPYSLHTRQWFLGTSYAANVLVWGVVLYFRLRPRQAPALPRGAS